MIPNQTAHAVADTDRPILMSGVLAYQLSRIRDKAAADLNGENHDIATAIASIDNAIECLQSHCELNSPTP